MNSRKIESGEPSASKSNISQPVDSDPSLVAGRRNLWDLLARAKVAAVSIVTGDEIPEYEAVAMLDGGEAPCATIVSIHSAAKVGFWQPRL